MYVTKSVVVMIIALKSQLLAIRLRATPPCLQCFAFLHLKGRGGKNGGIVSLSCSPCVCVCVYV